MGDISPSVGLAADLLQGFEMVTANGSLVTVDEGARWWGRGSMHGVHGTGQSDKRA